MRFTEETNVIDFLLICLRVINIHWLIHFFYNEITIRNNYPKLGMLAVCITFSGLSKNLGLEPLSEEMPIGDANFSAY